MGGPMMGVAQYSLDVPVVKHTNALLAFGENNARQEKETSCIRCGTCSQNCPMRLLPLYIDAAAGKKDIERLKKYHVTDCNECGVCEYWCPARRRIVQSSRIGKLLLKNSS
jgi:electron transport complex protein RnfC